MGLIFDITSGDWLNQLDENTAMDKEGNLFFRNGDHLAWDTTTDDFHDTSGWETVDDEG